MTKNVLGPVLAPVWTGHLSSLGPGKGVISGQTPIKGQVIGHRPRERTNDLSLYPVPPSSPVRNPIGGQVIGHRPLPRNPSNQALPPGAVNPDDGSP